MAKAKKETTREKKVTSFQIYTDTKKKIDTISGIDGVNITEIVETALTEYIGKWEKKNGQVPGK